MVFFVLLKNRFLNQFKLNKTLVFLGLFLVNLFIFPDLFWQAKAATVTWDGEAADGLWETATNWSGDAVPTAADDVVIDTAVTVNISAPTTINSLSLGLVDGSAASILHFAYDALSLGALTIDDGDVTVYSGANVRHSNGTSIVVGTILIDVQTGDFNLFGTINTDGRGYANSEGPGQGQDGDSSGGGGYGGRGGNGQSGRSGGSTYGSESEPNNLGSGAGHYNGGGQGGGAVKLIVAGVLTINGTVNANGAIGETKVGGGSGGSIWLIANELAGTGSLYANGGRSANSTSDGGGGGGGRIALYYSSNTSLFSNVSVAGGYGNSAQRGETGTIYYAGLPASPTSLYQYESNGTTLLSTGAETNENAVLVKFSVQDGDSSDTLTPEVEMRPIGTDFIGVATHTGDDVSYSGELVEASVLLNTLDDNDYHWQARSCDALGNCSAWISYGGNEESVADFTVSANNRPSNPTIPSSSFFINGQYSGSTQPSISFVTSDTDSADQVKYQIQIDDDSDFSSPEIDYESALAAQGTTSFTVGQAAGDGTYTVGSEGQSLSVTNYYWRVMVTDQKGSFSGWTTASGTPAFIVDTVRPGNASLMMMKSNQAAITSYAHDDAAAWFNRKDLYFSWDAGTDDIEVKGYCIYLGTDPNGDPATQKGLLGSSPASTSGSTCEFITNDTSIDFSSTALRGETWLSSSNDPYYFKVKTIDAANNPFLGDDTSNLISFYFDNTAPENVTAISAASGNFSNIADMYFNWPTAVGQAGSDANSGVLGFQFAINSQSDWIGDQTDSFTGMEYYSLGTEQPFYLPTAAQSLIQVGQNTIYFRVLDQVGNNSELRTAFINYGGAAPSFTPGAEVTVSPTMNDENNFSFSWPAATPDYGREIDSYYYMINTPPPTSLATITSNSATYIPTDSTSIAAASVSGLRKGSNTIYVVAVDDADNYSPTNTISATFYLNSELPDPPTNLTVSDSSIKDASIWRAALVWGEPAAQGTGDLTYQVQVSEDASFWSDVSSTTGLAYIDTVAQSQRYYWRVASTDNSDESIAAPSYSSAVSLIPRGKYTSAPSLTSGPAVSSITTSAGIVSWTTSRDADSRVVYGLASGNYFESEAAKSEQTTDHSIELNNLKPGTTYYYKAKWTDEDGNVGESDENTFTTEPPPEVKDITMTNLGVSGVILNFTTKNATKAKVYYGTSTSFGGAKEIGTSKLETSYSLELDQLEDGTKYYFKINTFDEEDEEYEGTILDFTTMPRPRVTGVRVQQVANTAQSSLLVTWESNTDVSSVVTYYPVNNPELVRDIVDLNLQSGEHQMLIKGLFPDTNYVVRVSGKDIIGNQATSDNINVTTASDSRAPMISDLTIEGANSPQVNGTAQATTSQLVISWNTDEPATSQIEYGEGSGDSYSQLSQEDQDLSYNHVVIISNLTPSKVYHLW
jgi:hypothetical protein